MLLEIVALSLDVGHEGLARRQLDSSDFSFSGIGFLRLCDENKGADTLALWTAPQQRGLGLYVLLWLFPTHSLIHGGGSGGRGMKRA